MPRSTLIGRSAPLATLDDLLTQAAAGHGHVALIVGEAGIGKSRLVTETCATATQRGFTTLRGDCFESDRWLPYAPLLDLLRSRWLGRDLHAITADVGPATDLLGLLPEIAAQRVDHPARPPADPDSHRRLAHAFVQLLRG